MRNEETDLVREYLIPQGKHLVVYEGDRVGVGEAHHRRRDQPARRPARQGHQGSPGVPRQRDPGGLPPAGRDDLRPPHRVHRPPDAGERQDRQLGRHAVPQGRDRQPLRLRRRQPPRSRRRAARRRRPSPSCSASRRPRSRRARSSRPRASRRRRASSPRPRRRPRSTT